MQTNSLQVGGAHGQKAKGTDRGDSFQTPPQWRSHRIFMQKFKCRVISRRRSCKPVVIGVSIEPENY